MATRRSIAREDRDLRIYQLAASGLTYRQISARESLSPTQVGRIVNTQAALHRDETLDIARDLILKRGQMIVQAHMPTIRDPKSADVIIRANEQQARLLGLFLPQQGAGVAEAASLLATLIDRDGGTDA